MLKNQAKAEDYRAKAREAAALAEASQLQQVRERQAIAAQTWTELAIAEERHLLSLGRRFDRAGMVTAESQ